MAQKEGFVSPRSTLVGQPGSEAPPGPHSLPGQFKSLFDENYMQNKRDSDFSKSLSWRRRRDLKFSPVVNTG